jgi:lipopolysaccharide export system protein LptC
MIACARESPEMRDSALQSLNLSRDAATAAGTTTVRRLARPSTGYSRFVSLMKFLLPAVAIGLLLLVVAWPRIQAGLDHLRLSFARLDLTEARDLRMVNARFSGIDKRHRPFVLTANVARQMPDRNDLMALEGPKGDITLQNGAWLAVTAFTGVYLTQGQILDLFGDVKLFHDRGYELTTDTAHVDMAGGTAEGNDPVQGQGVFGDVTSEGFRLLDHGQTIIFTGKSRLHIAPRLSEEPK